MNKEIKDILAKGLGQGYVGNTTSGKTDRAGFPLKTSDYKGPEGTYHDEWAAAHHNGGGQELVEGATGEKATRVYAGGSLDDESLKKLGLTNEDVRGKLVLFVNQLGVKTRLDENAEATEGEWTYTYKIIKSVKEIPVDIGEEEIRFNGKLVFVHYHINSPVR